MWSHIPTHWMSRTPIYKVYSSIKSRCNNKNNPSYKDYWWRWIKCEWRTFEEFYEDIWKNYIIWNSTIDRINNNWNYCKENCKLSNNKEQSRNTRRNKIIEYKWQKKCLAEWLELYWINYEVWRQRLLNWWDIDLILNTKVWQNKWTKNRMFIKQKMLELWKSESSIRRLIKKWIISLI